VTVELLKVIEYSKSFSGREIHSGVNFSLNESEIVALIGGSGSGKSVLLKSIIGLIRPDSGDLLYRGVSVLKMNHSEIVSLRKKIAYVFQEGALFDSLTVFDNLMFPLNEHSDLSKKEKIKKIESVLDSLDILQAKELLPSSLSGGMRKRAGLARSLVLDPEIILYDEPTAGLDPKNTLNIQQMISKFKDLGVSGILVTHDMPTALNCADKMALLSGGKIIASGNCVELTKKNQHVKDFMNGEL